jgi:WD40 repeat protein
MNVGVDKCFHTYLRETCPRHPGYFMLREHSNITAITLTADLEYFAIGDVAGYVYIVDASWVMILNIFRAHVDYVSRIKFNSTGVLYTAGVDSLVKVWTDFYNYQIYPDFVFLKHTDCVVSMNFVKSGIEELVFSQDSMGNCYLWHPVNQRIQGYGSFPLNSYVVGGEKMCVGFFIRDNCGIIRRRVYSDVKQWDELVLEHYGGNFDTNIWQTKIGLTRSEWFHQNHGVSLALSKQNRYLSVWKRNKAIDFIDLEHFRIAHR